MLLAAIDAAIEAGRAADDEAQRAATLRLAALRGRGEVVDELLAAGVAVDAADRSDSTALAYAINAGHADVVRRLLVAGADPDQVTVYPAAGLASLEVDERSVNRRSE